MYLLGFDVGSSSVKASLLNSETGETIASAFYPAQEMPINAPSKTWAEQDPAIWWENLCLAGKDVCRQIHPEDVKAIGISYQMHGLVIIDKDRKVLRPSIIWCDSRAVEQGQKAFEELGAQKCLSHSLNSPGNFTASKFKWVMENERDIFDKTWKIMLPGDFINMKMTGEVNTTISGLSEGILWDFKENSPARYLMDHMGISDDHIPEIVPGFSIQGKLNQNAAKELGLAAGIPVAYRAGDQPNNALSLNVLNPGEIAATAGTSGVVYGVSSEVKYDTQSRVNTFAHVNHSSEQSRLGVLLCINGTGILYSWLKKNFGDNAGYHELNGLAASVSPGSDGLSVFPFGNGAERMLNNVDYGARIDGLNFNRHERGHIIRAGQEGIVFSFLYGMEIMKELGINPEVLRAGNANMFLSPVFRETLANTGNLTIELYDTDGASGAARAAGYGAEIYHSLDEALGGLKKIQVIEPSKNTDEFTAAYAQWKDKLESFLK